MVVISVWLLFDGVWAMNEPNVMQNMANYGLVASAGARLRGDRDFPAEFRPSALSQASAG